METLNRYYRVLGLPPGAPKADVKRAYRDLAQVWHPDRFVDNERLRQKAETNLRKINEAYEKLKDLTTPAGPARRVSRLSETYQAIVDLGDMVRTSLTGFARPPRTPKQVLGLDIQPEPRGSRARRPKTKDRSGLSLFLVVAMATFVAVVYLFYR